MQQVLKYYSLIATIAILILIFLFRECKNVETKTITNTQIIKQKPDTVTKVIKIPTYIVQTSIQKDSIPVIRDSLIYIKELFALHAYKRLFQDSNIFITTYDTVNKDSLYRGGITYSWRKPTTIIQMQNNKGKVYLGGMVGGNLTQLSSLSIFGVYTTPKDHFYQLGYNFMDKSVFVGIAFKIHL